MRKLLLLALAVVLVASVAACLVLTRPTPASQINKQNQQLINDGMTLQQVEAIFGGPAGDYSTRLPPGPKKFIRTLPEQLGDRNYKLWAGNGGIIVVYFDEGNRVETAIFYSSFVSQEPSILEKIRRLLRL